MGSGLRAAATAKGLRLKSCRRSWVPQLVVELDTGAARICLASVDREVRRKQVALLEEPSGEGDDELLLLHLKALSTTKHFPAAARCV